MLNGKNTVVYLLMRTLNIMQYSQQTLFIIRWRDGCPLSCLSVVDTNKLHMTLFGMILTDTWNFRPPPWILVITYIQTFFATFFVLLCFSLIPFLLKGEEPPMCIGCDKRLTLEHILLTCSDFIEIREPLYS